MPAMSGACAASSATDCPAKVAVGVHERPRVQHKGPPGSARMRQRQHGVSLTQVTVDDDVHIQGAGTPAHFAGPVVGQFHGLAVRQQLIRVQGGVHGNDHVQEIGLARRAAHGFGGDHG